MRIGKLLLLAATAAALATSQAAAQTKTKITYWAWTEHVAAANAVNAEF